jgi:hypothetical protein
MAELFLSVAAAAYAVAVFMASRFIVGRAFAPRVRPWVYLPVAAAVTVLPFLDELYNERETRLACASEGGMAVVRTVSARTLDAGMALIDARSMDSEFPHYWRRELLFLYRPTGEELGHLRWFERKGGWLRGKRPGAGLASAFRPVACPDPQPLLLGGAARRRLVQTPPG